MNNISNKFSTNLKKVIIDASVLVPCGDKLKPKHLLLALLKNTGCVGREILNIGPRSEKLKKILAGAKPQTDLNKISLSASTIKLLEKASILSFEYSHLYIGTEHLLFGLIAINNKEVKNILSNLSVNVREISERLKIVLKSMAKFSDLAATFKFNKESSKNTVIARSPKNIKNPMLRAFGSELTDAQIQENIDPIIGREKEIKRLIQIVMRRTKNNPLLLGNPGVGKTAIVEGLAKKIMEGDVPYALANKKIFTLDLGLLIAGTMFRGEFENRLKQIINEVKKNPNIILFIDEIHHLVGAGAAQGSMDAAGILKPALARGELRIIGATTKEEYQKYMENDAAFERRFQIIYVNEPAPDKTKNILRGLRKNYEQYHNIKISDSAIESAVILSERYIKDRFLPDKAIDLIDEASAMVKLNQESDNNLKKIRRLEKKINEADQKKIESILKENFELALNFKKQTGDIKQKISLIKEAKQMDNSRRTITENDILKIVSDITSIPLQKLDNDKLLKFELQLGKKIIGQKESIKIVSDAIKSAYLGLRSKDRPLASFIFAGPSGVGKTELAKNLATELFQDKESFIRIDMSEFRESFNISKLIGAPAGYVGYKESGKLTEAVKRNPYSLILLDEIEKAHPDIFNLLLQILEDGQLTDASGRMVNFRNTIIIMTSNIGSDKFNNMGLLGFDHVKSNQRNINIKKDIIKELKNFFRPEFINRIDEILIFNCLNHKNLEKISALRLDELAERLKEKKIYLSFSPKVKKFIAQSQFSQEEGARIIRKNISKLIENPLTELIIQKNIKSGTINVKIINNQIIFDLR